MITSDDELRGELPRGRHSQGSNLSLPRLRNQFVVNIDHHSTTTPFGDINWIDSTAAAVGEMIYNLCKALGVEVTKEIAECIYTALLTDTGSFHFSNTTERTLKIASELVRRGVEPARISQALFYSNSLSKIKLLGLVLSSIQLDESGRIAWIRMDRETMHEAGASEEEADGIANHALSIGEVEAVAFFKELGPILKEGVSQDWSNRERIAGVLLFESTKTEPGKFTSLDEYLERVPVSQEVCSIRRFPARRRALRRPGAP